MIIIAYRNGFFNSNCEIGAVIFSQKKRTKNTHKKAPQKTRIHIALTEYM